MHGIRSCLPTRGVQRRHPTPFVNRLGRTTVALVFAQALLLPTLARAQSPDAINSSKAGVSPEGDRPGAAPNTTSTAPARSTKPVTFVLQGGMGAVAPVTPGGGVGISLSHGIARGFSLGISAHATGGAGTKKELGSKDSLKTSEQPVSSAFMYEAGFLLTWTAEGTGLAPTFGVGTNWGKLKAIDIERSNRPYEGSGLVLSAQAGVLISGSYPILVRADVPTFQLHHTVNADERLYALSMAVEFGIMF